MIMEATIPMRPPSFTARRTSLRSLNHPKQRLYYSPVSSSSSAASVTNTEPASTSLGHVTRPDFPILHQEVNGKRLVYLDNAATSQKPATVLKALQNYYEAYNSNVHPGIHSLSARATEEYEMARSKVASFVNASESSEIIFTRNATEAINLVAYSWGLLNLKPGDEVLSFESSMVVGMIT